MIRGTSMVLGVGLVVLWIAGLSSATAPAWLTWLDLIGAVGAFVVAGLAGPEITAVRDRVIGPAVLSLGLFALWIIGLATTGAVTLAWWNFAFACAFGLLAIFGGRDEKRITTTTRFEEPYRRSA